jgi:C-terminal processing protease CtpA/Prc
VQVFALAYWPNLSGDVFSTGDDRSRGWPTYMTSMKIDTENQDEISGGKVVVWAPDDQQSFPTGFGADGLLFTADDPLGPVPAGYSVIDLDQKPFEISRNSDQQVALYEPEDVVIKDFSDLSYSEAFQKLLETVRSDYAFNGISGKQPDWDRLAADLTPRVEAAEKNHDPMAFYLALNDFVLAFKDGHVGLDGGEAQSEDYTRVAGGGYGFALRELDDGTVMVVYVLEDGPAAAAGIKVGDEVTGFNGEKIGDAISKVQPLSGPFSTSFAERYQQVRFLLRAPLETEAKITFQTPGKASTARTVTLKAIDERNSFTFTSIYKSSDPSAPPVESVMLTEDIGYVRVNSNDDDLNLIVRLFERALKTFEKNGVKGLIIDMRQNSGGSPLGLAGFLTDQIIPLGQLEYFSSKDGKFEPDGPREKVYPMQNQYHFEKMALLVDQACFSACEIEAYSFSQVPGMMVFGQYPTAGVEAEVARGQFKLPEGMSLQVPTGRFTLPDGSLFLEGVGVEPTVRVPVDAETVLSDQDPVLIEAATAVIQ